jgi:hypothetical protein
MGLGDVGLNTSSRLSCVKQSYFFFFFFESFTMLLCSPLLSAQTCDILGGVLVSFGCLVGCIMRVLEIYLMLRFRL